MKANVGAPASGIYADLIDCDHVQAKELKSDGIDGYLVVGPNGLTVLKNDNKTIAFTFPLSFLENYAKDAGQPNVLLFNLKHKAVKKGEQTAFMFQVASEEIVQTIVGSIDRYFFGNPAAIKAAKTGAPKARPQRASIGLPKRASSGNVAAEVPMGDWDGRFADVKNRTELFDTKEKSGERFTGLKSIVPLKKSSILGGREDKVPAITLFSKTGISVLTFAEEHGFIEVHPWTSIRSFGASSADCFGFQVKSLSGEEVFVCCYSEQSGHTMETLASKYAKANESLELMTERDRATTKGVEVVANSGLIQSDINNFEHVPVKREKQSGKSGNQFQDGFLVIGIAAVTFLDKTKSVVSSHPLSHVDYYFREGDKGFTYNIQMRNVAKKGQKVKFAFIAESPEKAQFLLASMDKYIFENKNSAPIPVAAPSSNTGGTSPRVSPRIGARRSRQMSGNDFLTPWDTLFHPVGGGDAVASGALEGIRFVGQKSTLASVMNKLGDRSHVVAVLSLNGLALLQCKGQKGTVENFPWNSLKSFGVSGADTFGFQTTVNGEETTICIVLEGDGGVQMEAMAQKFLDASGVDHTTGRDRSETKGIAVLSDGFVSEKARQEQIASDLESFEHIAVSRIRTTTTGREDGFLVVGVNAITFLGKDKSVIASHPISLIEAYSADIKNEKAFTYALKKSKLDSADDLRAFSFELFDKERVSHVIGSFDKCMFFSKADMDPFGGAIGGAAAAAASSGEGGVRDAAFHDKSARQSSAPAATRLEGNRIVVTKTYMSEKRVELIRSAPKVRAVAVLSPQGIVFLSADKQGGQLEAFPWKEILTFGATGEDCFGFKIKDEKGEAFVCLYTSQSGHLLNLLAKKYSRMSEAGPSEPITKEYRP